MAAVGTAAAAAAILILVLLLTLSAAASGIKRDRARGYEHQGRRDGGEPGRVFFHVSQG